MLLIGVSQTSHTGHNSQDVIVGSIDTDLSSLGAFNCGIRQDQLQCGVINTREVASARGLMFFGAEGKRVNIDTFIRVSGVGLVRLDPREVRAFTFREAILAVQLELSSDNWVLAPAVHVQGGFSQNEGTSIGDSGVIIVAISSQVLELSKDGRRKIGASSICRNIGTSKVGFVVWVLGTMPVASEAIGDVSIKSTSILEQTTSINVRARVSSNGLRTSESVNSIGESINSISVVERLSTQYLEQESITYQGRAVVNVLIRLDNPDQFLYRVVEVEFDLVTGRTNRFITSELQLSDQVFVRILGKSASFISVQEDIVNIQRGSNQGLVVGNSSRNRATWSILVSLVGSRGLTINNRLSRSSTGVAGQGSNSPQAFINGSDIQVDLDFMILQSDQRKSQSWVGTEPELKRDIQSGFGEGITRSTNLTRSQGVTRAINFRERGISDEGKLGSITNHLEVTTLLFGSHGQLVPDVHPVTILTINSLTTNFDFNLSDQLFAREVQPTSIDTRTNSSGEGSDTHKLVNFGQSDLQVSSVSQITISADGALYSATKISLTIESLFDRFNSEVSISSVSNLPESNLRITCTFPLPYLSIRSRLYLKMN